MDVNRRPRLTHRVRDLSIIAACLLSQATYLLIGWLNYGRFGFPLDDAWIYQTYARNLAHTGLWAFVPGIPSTGSTSILWTVLIAPIHLFSLDPRWYTQLLGFAMLAATALGAARLYDEDPPLTSLLVGLAVALEWHLVWAAASGMETMLFAALLIWYWHWLRHRDPALVGHTWSDGALVGLWGGMLMLSRPEGVLVFVVTVVYGLLVPDKPGPKLLWLLLAGISFALIASPFFGLNVLISGDFWPNTFSAKQTEYASLAARSYLWRFWEQISVIFIGAQLVLLPGIIYELYRDIRYRTDWISLVPWVWAVVHLALYAARLPVIYQHGRYAIPVIPILLIYGVRGLLRLARPRHRNMGIRLASAGWLATVGVLFPMILLVLGAPAYARDVDFIESEMVSTARWVQTNIEPDSVIAAHDIGALGYFAPHPLLDLAGLISPDVIPTMNNPANFEKFVLGSDAEYLIAFPAWSEAYTAMLTKREFCPIWSAAESEGYDSPTPLGPLTVYKITHSDGCP